MKHGTMNVKLMVYTRPHGVTYQTTGVKESYCDWSISETTVTWGGVGTALLVGGSRDRSPVTGNFFRGIRQFHVPWGRLRIFLGVKTAGV